MKHPKQIAARLTAFVLCTTAFVLLAWHGWERWRGPAVPALDQAKVPKILKRYYEMPITLLGEDGHRLATIPPGLLATGSLVYVEEKWAGTYRLRPIGEVAGRTRRSHEGTEVECVQLAIQPQFAERVFGDQLHITYCAPDNAFETLLAILVSEKRKDQLAKDLDALWTLRGTKVKAHVEVLFNDVSRRTNEQLKKTNPEGVVQLTMKEVVKVYFDAYYSPKTINRGMSIFLEEFLRQLLSEEVRPLLRQTLDKLWNELASVPYEGLDGIHDVGIQGIARRYLLVEDPQEGTMFTPEVVLILRRLIFKTHLAEEKPWRPADSWVVLRLVPRAEPDPARVRVALSMSNPAGIPIAGRAP